MLDKLKSLFIIQEEDDKTKKKETEKLSQKEVKVTTPTKKKLVKTVVQSEKGTLNKKIMTKLLTVLSDSNLEGFDYIEFKNAIKALETMPMDEKTKYRSAFATAQTIGVTVPKLLETVEYYQGVLNNENDQFSNALNQQVELKVGDKQSEIESYEGMIKAKTHEVTKLTEDIAKHQKMIASLQSKIEEDTVHIQKTRVDFETTFDKLMHQINEDVEKIELYLK